MMGRNEFISCQAGPGYYIVGFVGLIIVGKFL
jgi:hypothetical protein